MSQTHIVLGGEGGQGVQTIAEILAEAGFNLGLESLYIPNFGVEQRGGVSLAFVQLGDEPISAPKFNRAEVVVALSDRAVDRTRSYASPDGVFVYESSSGVTSPALPDGSVRLLPVPAIALASERLHPRVFNILILGVVVGLIPELDAEGVRRVLETRLQYKFERQPELKELNFRALDQGMELAGSSVEKERKIH